MMILVMALMSVTAVSQAARPRGVRPELGSMYNPSTDFKCFDASNVIPFSQVNDDYCDCEVRREEFLYYFISLLSLISLIARITPISLKKLISRIP